MSLRPLLRALSLIGAFFILNACDRSTEIPENDPGFSDYIAAHTSGLISAYSSIEIHLAQDLNPGVSPGTLIEAELFSFKPDIKGQAFWQSSNRIEFIPEEPLQPGQNYRVEFELGSIASVNSAFRSFEFIFQAIEQTYTLLGFTINPYQKTDLIWNQIKGTLSTTDQSSAEELLAALDFSGIKAERVSWNQGSTEHRWEFVIDSLERKEEAYEFNLTNNREELAELRVPGLGDFEIVGVYVEQLPAQKVSISFSDPLSTQQVTAGMFQINNSDVQSVEIEGSVVHLYPSSRINGNVPLKVFPGLKNILGYKFPKEYNSTVSFQARKPEIQFVNSGTIIPTSGATEIPFQAVSLNAVDVKIYQVFANNVHQFLQVNRLDGERELRRVARPIHRERIPLDLEDLNPNDWTTFSIDLDRIIDREPGAIYRLELSFRQSYSLYPCVEGTDNESLKTLEETEWEEEEESFEENYYHYWYRPGYNYRERDNPCHVSYYNSNRRIERNVLASDIGLVVKGTDKEWYAYTQKLSTTEALSGIAVEFYNYQGQLIDEVNTDADGYAKIQLETRPFLAMAKHGAERAYLTLENSRALSLSSFAVGGRDISDGIEGMIYTERGIWRPGDTIFLDFILNDNKNPLPQNHPIVLTVDDPRGQEIYRSLQTRSSGNIFSFPFTTLKEAITGLYSARISVGGKTFYKSLPIETIQANRLDISVEAPEDIIDGSVQGETHIKLDAEWLTGAKGSELKAQMRGSISGNPGAFRYQHPLFDFYDDTRSVPDLSGSQLFEGDLDANGHADVYANLGYLSASPGMLRLNIGSKVFEPGGRFSINSTTLDLAPYKHFVGIQMPETNRYGYLETEKTHPMGLIRVNPKGEPETGKVRIRVFKVNWSWWWSAQRGRASYLNNNASKQLYSEVIELKNGKGVYQLNIPDNHWGRLFVIAEDLESGHKSSALAYVDWAYGRDRSGRSGGESVSVLNVQTDKEQYEVGETAQISVPSSAGGRLILSYENSNGQITQKVLKTQEGSTMHELEITSEMAPNCYAHAMILQPHSAKGNDLPLRLYGIIPLMVEDPASHLQPLIEAPSEIRPNSEFTLKIREKNQRDMEYTVAIVDEGLLGLNNFQSPNPWPQFYSKIALGVRSWDLYDLVIGGYSGEIAKVLAVGGDAALLDRNEEDADRFIPVVRHIGPFFLKGGKSAEHQLEMPNYLGNVRVMVVAANAEDAYGAADTNIRVKQPLMVQMTVPRVLGPEESLAVPVTVFAMNDKVKKVKLKMEVGGQLELLEDSKNISFSEEGQQTVYFDAKVKRALGKAKLKIIATSGSEKSYEEVEITVRSPMLRQQKIHAAVVDGASAQFKAEPFGIEGSNRLIVELSSLPKMNLNERLSYLIGYPHGCLEQTTSKVFSQLNLEKWVTLDVDQKAAIREYINAGLGKLRSLQLADGGFKYWPGNSYHDPYASTYVGHFIIAAEKAGYKLPAGMKTSYLRFARKQAREWTSSSSYYRSNNDFNQAYRLYVMALAGKPELGAMTRLRNRKGMSKAAAFRLAAAYALIGEKEAARDLVKDEYQEPDSRYYYYSYGSATRDLAMQMETFYDMGDRKEALLLAQELAKKLGEGWHSTQTLAYSLQALSRIFESGSDKIEAKITIDGKSKTISSDLSLYQWETKDFDTQTIEVESLNGKALYFNVVREGLPVYGTEVAQSNRMSLRVRYLDQSENEMDVSRLKIGTPLIAEINVQRSSVSKDFENLAVSQIFPSGWEITNSRVLAGAEEESSQLDYQDIRDDRVLSYYNGYRHGNMTIRVELTATYPGRWYLPPVMAEAMYEGSVNANNVGQWVEVVSE